MFIKWCLCSKLYHINGKEFSAVLEIVCIIFC